MDQLEFLRTEFVSCEKYPDTGFDDLNHKSRVVCNWQCSVCGYEWSTRLSHRTIRNTGCNKCSSKRTGIKLSSVPENRTLRYLYPEIADQFVSCVDTDKTPENLGWSSNKMCTWRCFKNHVWDSTVNNRTGTGMRGCPVCSTNRSSRFEFEIAAIIEASIGFECTVDRTVATENGRVKVDLFIADLDLYIDIDPPYWHRDSLERDKRKLKKCSAIPFIKIRSKDLEHIEGTLTAVDETALGYVNALKSLLDMKNISFKTLTPIEVSQCLGNAGVRWVSTVGAPETSALDKRPDLAVEFIQNMTRPGLDLSMVSYGTGDRGLWKCPVCDTTYEARISSKVAGARCRTCYFKTRRKL